MKLLSEMACPYCNCDLKKEPKKKTKCLQCGKSIYPRTRYGDNARVLAKENEKVIIDVEATWIKQFEYEKVDLEGIKKSLEKKFGCLPKTGDIIWSVLIKRAVSAVSSGELGIASRCYSDQARYLKQIGKNPSVCIKEAMRCELRGYKNNGFEHVEYTSGACEHCKDYSNKAFTIDEAMNKIEEIVNGCDGEFCMHTFLPK